MEEQQCNCMSRPHSLMDRGSLLPSGFCTDFVKQFSQILWVFVERYYLYPAFMCKPVILLRIAHALIVIVQGRKEGSLFYRWGKWNTGRWPFQLVQETRTEAKVPERGGLAIKTHFPKQTVRLWWGTTQRPCSLIRWTNFISARL